MHACFPIVRMALLALTLFLVASPVQAQEILIGGGGGVEGDGFSIQAGSIYLAVGEPGILAGATKKRISEYELFYLIVFKHKATDGSQVNHSAQTESSDGGSFHSKLEQSLEMHGQKLLLNKAFEIDTATGMVKSEEATINGQKVDLSKGRLFLVDFTGDKLTWKQVNGKLPTKVGSLGDLDGVRKLAKQVREEMPKESTDVQEFLK